jgi:sarcosine oxidase subunit beta
VNSDTPQSAKVVICGAGIAGISTAFHLTRLGVSDIVVVDPRPPLTLTSDKSTECYRNWWPSTSMVSFMSRSIDLLEEYALESGNRFSLSRRGYLYVTASMPELESMTRQTASISELGAGDVRTFSNSAAGYEPAALDGYETTVDGADIFTTGKALREAFDFISGDAVGAIHVRRAGWLSAQQLGAWMIEQTIETGVTYVRGTVTNVGTDEVGVRSVTIDDLTTVVCKNFVNAGGPLARDVGTLLGTAVPVTSEIHQKVSFKDHKGAFPRHAPMVIWNDPQRLDWEADTRAFLSEEGRAEVMDELPAFVHGRPEGGLNSEWALGLWEWNTKSTTSPTWPLDDDPLYPELVVRGLSAMLPGMASYQDALPEHTVDGGYYTKTVENLPLIGPIGPEGSFICAALSGYGIMAACAAGELAAAHVSRASLPRHAPAFSIARYDDPLYMRSIQSIDTTGQI